MIVCRTGLAAVLLVSLCAFSGPTSESDLERTFRSIPDPARMRDAVKVLSAHAHHVGSPGDRENAEWILARFKEWGLDASVENFEVLFPTPLEREVELVEPRGFKAVLQEPPVAQDPTSSHVKEQ